MKTKPDKQLVQYCEVLMVLSAFSATSLAYRTFSLSATSWAKTQATHSSGLPWCKA